MPEPDYREMAQQARERARAARDRAIAAAERAKHALEHAQRDKDELHRRMHEREAADNAAAERLHNSAAELQDEHARHAEERRRADGY